MGSGPEVLAPTGATPCCRSKGPRSRVLFSHNDVAWWWGKGGEEKEVEAGRGRGGEEEEEEKLGEGPTFVLPPRAPPWRRGSVAAAVGRRSRGPRPNMGGKDAWSGRRCSTSARPAAAGREGERGRRRKKNVRAPILGSTQPFPLFLRPRLAFGTFCSFLCP